MYQEGAGESTWMLQNLPQIAHESEQRTIEHLDSSEVRCQCYSYPVWEHRGRMARGLWWVCREWNPSMTTLVRRLTRRKVERVCKSENRSTAHSIISRHGCSRWSSWYKAHWSRKNWVMTDVLQWPVLFIVNGYYRVINNPQDDRQVDEECHGKPYHGERRSLPK